MKRKAASSSSGAKIVKKSPSLKKLGREFYDQPSVELSQALLGKVLVRKLPSGEVVRGTIVETEAYPGEGDQASRAYHTKQTEKNAAMFMQPGTAYVYLTYGMYHCINITAQGEGAAILLRGVEPLDDYGIMHQHRSKSMKKKETSSNSNGGKKKDPLKIYELANGPGKLCLAFDITRATCDKLDLCASDLMWLEDHEETKFHQGNFAVEESKRVGIDSAPKNARDQLWRFHIEDNFAVSTAKPNQIKKKLQIQSQQTAT